MSKLMTYICRTKITCHIVGASLSYRFHRTPDRLFMGSSEIIQCRGVHISRTYFFTNSEYFHRDEVLDQILLLNPLNQFRTITSIRCIHRNNQCQSYLFNMSGFLLFSGSHCLCCHKVASSLFAQICHEVRRHGQTLQRQTVNWQFHKFRALSQV